MAVKLWGGNHHGSGPSGGGPISHPELWTHEELVSYIGLFNEDQSHAVIDYQDDEDFQLELEYYVINIMN